MLSAMPNARFELTADDRRAVAEAERRLEYRALERCAARRHLRLSCWVALVPTAVLAVLAWNDGGPPLGALALLCLAFAMALPVAWIGLGLLLWIAEAVEDGWDLFFGD